MCSRTRWTIASRSARGSRSRSSSGVGEPRARPPRGRRTSPRRRRARRACAGLPMSWSERRPAHARLVGRRGVDGVERVVVDVVGVIAVLGHAAAGVELGQHTAPGGRPRAAPRARPRAAAPRSSFSARRARAPQARRGTRSATADSAARVAGSSSNSSTAARRAARSGRSASSRKRARARPPRAARRAVEVGAAARGVEQRCRPADRRPARSP